MPNITAILPFFWDKDNSATKDQVIGELLNLSGQISTSMNLVSGVPIEITHFLRAQEQRGLAKRISQNPENYSRQFLRFRISIADPTSSLVEEYKDIPQLAVERVNTHLCTYALAQRVGDIVLALNIANPGLIHFDPYFIYVDGRFQRKERGFSWILAEPVSYAKHLGWPPISTFPVDVVWRWLVTLPDFDTGMVQGRVGRALSALTYLIPASSADTSPSDLVWALLGLEALYCTGNQGLKSQLMEKSAIVLGPRLANTKKFNAMYDYRSRFLHGDLDFPRSYFEIEHDHVETFIGEAYDCWSIAVSMLVSTIQYLVRNNLTTLEFGYSVKHV